MKPVSEEGADTGFTAFAGFPSTRRGSCRRAPTPLGGLLSASRSSMEEPGTKRPARGRPVLEPEAPGLAERLTPRPAPVLLGHLLRMPRSDPRQRFIKAHPSTLPACLYNFPQNADDAGVRPVERSVGRVQLTIRSRKASLWANAAASDHT
jgi:hypothetical protein